MSLVISLCTTINLDVIFESKHDIDLRRLPGSSPQAPFWTAVIACHCIWPTPLHLALPRLSVKSSNVNNLALVHGWFVTSIGTYFLIVNKQNPKHFIIVLMNNQVVQYNLNTAFSFTDCFV